MTINWVPNIDDNTKPLFLTIARSLADDIANGRLKADDPLPTQRELADRLGVAVGTVTRAYAEAVKRGLIRANGRRGTFVGSAPSRDSALNSLIKPASQAIDFSIIHPVYSQDPDLGRILKKLGQRADVNNLLRYPNSQGVLRHRQAGAEWIKRLGKTVNPESVIISAGGQNGLFITLSAVTEPGEAVLAEELVYPGIKAAAETLQLRLYGLTLDQEGLLPDALEAAVKKTGARVLYCTPDLQNPTTGVMSTERRRALGQIARKYNLLVIEDAIHRPLLPDPPQLIAEYAPEQTILLASISKTVGSGLRVGFITGPDLVLPRIQKTKQTINMMVPPLPLEVFATWLEDGVVDQTMENKRKETRQRQDILGTILSEFDVKTNDYSYFSWLVLPREINRTQFAITAYQQNISVATAEIFAVNESNAPEAVRICLATPDSRESVEAGLRIIAGILKKDRYDRPFYS